MKDLERRYFESSIALRAADGDAPSRSIEGYAFKYNSWSRKIGGWFYERIDPGFIADLKLDEMDIVALFNHDNNKILARTISKTLQLENDAVGLKYVFDSPETTTGNDLLVSVGRGDIQHSSFAFITAPGGDKWERDDNGDERRTLLKASRIIDVSPVVHPAYLDTTVAKRSFEGFNNEIRKKINRREMARRRFDLMFNV